MRAMARLGRLAERGLGDLPLAHYRVLSAVAEGDQRASRVARRFALGKPTVSVAVDALTKAGLLTKNSEADDQRATALALTARGRAVLAEAERTLVAALHAVLDHAETDGLVTALADIGRAIEAEARERSS